MKDLSKTQAAEWVEDAALGVAVREVHGTLQVKVRSVTGWRNYERAVHNSLASPHWQNQGRCWAIASTDRLAFARALSPIEAAVTR